MGFEGLFLDKESEELLADETATLGGFLEKRVEDPHITFEYGDEITQYPKEHSGEYEVTVIGFGSNKNNTGFLVDIPKELEALYSGAVKKHITMSLSGMGKAVDTKDLDFHPITPFVVKCHLGMKEHGKCVETI